MNSPGGHGRDQVSPSVAPPASGDRCRRPRRAPPAARSGAGARNIRAPARRSCTRPAASSMSSSSCRLPGRRPHTPTRGKLRANRRLREIDGERFVVLSAGTPDRPFYTVGGRPALKLVCRHGRERGPKRDHGLSLGRIATRRITMRCRRSNYPFTLCERMRKLLRVVMVAEPKRRPRRVLPEVLP